MSSRSTAPPASNTMTMRSPSQSSTKPATRPKNKQLNQLTLISIMEKTKKFLAGLAAVLIPFLLAGGIISGASQRNVDAYDFTVGYPEHLNFSL